MMRSLWSAASGMNAQQRNVDVISNNLANVNTYGYKKERLEFKTLLYDTMQKTDLDRSTQSGRPVNLQVGLGVRPIATARIFTAGNLQITDVMTDFAIEGDGFFTIRYKPEDEEYNVGYTRDGAFKVGMTDGGLMLMTAEGYAVLNTDGTAILFPEDVALPNISMSGNGVFSYTDAEGNLVDLGMQLNIVQFTNPQGLEAIGSNLLIQTAASGEPISESEGTLPKTSTVRQGVLEMSNVLVADEMISLIVAQRAYDLNSKAILASDEMLQTANNLRR